MSTEKTKGKLYGITYVILKACHQWVLRLKLPKTSTSLQMPLFYIHPASLPVLCSILVMLSSQGGSCPPKE